jgi:histidinol-phosphate aminotransferase
VKLDQNEVSSGCPQSIRDAIQGALQEMDFNRYPALHPGDLQEALGKLNHWPADGILIGNGSNDLLLTLALSILEKGRKALVPTPSFSSFSTVSRLAGAEVIEVLPEGDLSHPVEHYLDGIDEFRPAVVFLCSPNNPTGTSMSLEDIEKVVRRFPGFLVVDEAYFEFAGSSARPLLPDYPNLLLLRTFSKAAGLAGLRVGYMLAHPEIAAEIGKAQMPYAVNQFSRTAALAVCRHYDSIRTRAREIADRRDSLFERLSKIDGIQPYPSAANFILFGCAAGARPVFEGLLSRGVLVRDLSSHPLLPTALRVTVGSAEENQRFLSAMQETLEVTR